jgi:multidrug efflux pump subunit AcrB
VEAAPRFRATTDALKQFQVRTGPGQMVPLGAMARAESSTTPLLVMRYNMYASAAINGNPAPGVSTGAMIDGIMRMASELGIPFE